ncbi:MAG: DUF2029 domain-containing protein [Thioalkalivibrio sp.]|nr:DUF2029 domain-containing protein [Thioalkalivibrio sp.]
MRSVAWIPLYLAAVGPLAFLVAKEFADRIHLINHGIFKFWLAGNMIANGLSPYDSDSWLTLHREFGSVWLANSIFLYPPTLAYLLVPIGSLELRSAFIAWGTGTLVAVVATVLLMVQRWDLKRPAFVSSLLVLLIAAYYPVAQSLANSTMAGFFLLSLCLSVVAASDKPSFLRGLLVGVVSLKPSIGVPIAGVMGLWMLAARDLRGVAGVVTAVTLIAGVSLVHDPLWVMHSTEEIAAQMGRVTAKQPTPFNFSMAVCSQNVRCAYPLTVAFWMLVFARVVWVCVKQAHCIEPFAAVSIAVSWALIATPYVWPYDYLLLLLPFLWITERMLQRNVSPVLPVAFWLGVVAITYATTPAIAAGNLDYAMNFFVPLLTFLIVHVMIFVESEKTPKTDLT